MASAGQIDSQRPESGFPGQGHGMTWAGSWNDPGGVDRIRRQGIRKAPVGQGTLAIKRPPQEVSHGNGTED